jgi:hypothetical protein
MNTIDIPLVHTVDVAGPKNFDYPLYQGSLSCPSGLTATASVGGTWKGSARKQQLRYLPPQ